MPVVWAELSHSLYVYYSGTYPIKNKQKTLWHCPTKSKNSAFIAEFLLFCTRLFFVLCAVFARGIADDIREVSVKA
jgi:hypothetical protein